MNSVHYLRIFFVCGLVALCEGITNNADETNLVGEEERRGVNLKKGVHSRDQRNAATQKSGLWIIGQANPQAYPSGYGATGTDPGYQGYGESAYGVTSTGYGYDTGASGGYYKRPSAYGHSVVGSNFGYGGGGLGHSGGGVAFGHGGGEYGVSGFGEHHGTDIYKKLALKKFLIPLAGLAILGAAAALSSNPVLLQLGTISGRKRRSVPEAHRDVYPSNPWVKPSFTK